jgi:hypothetical protein
VWLAAWGWLGAIAGSAPATEVETAMPTGFSLGGTTGLVTTPTADVMPDRAFHFGFMFVDQKWAFAERDNSDNEIYFITMGFLPRLEASVRATVFPNTELLEGEDAPQVDRSASARLQILRGGRWPAVAVGIDDVRGNRLFHSLYVVGTQSIQALTQVELRGSLGYGSTALDAREHTLDGVFGGFEGIFWHRASLIVDLDTEKVNSSIRLMIFNRVSLHLAWLDLETVSGGLGWTQVF